MGGEVDPQFPAAASPIAVAATAAEFRVEYLPEAYLPRRNVVATRDDSPEAAEACRRPMFTLVAGANTMQS